MQGELEFNNIHGEVISDLWLFKKSQENQQNISLLSIKRCSFNGGSKSPPIGIIWISSKLQFFQVKRMEVAGNCRWWYHSKCFKIDGCYSVLWPGMSIFLFLVIHIEAINRKLFFLRKVMRKLLLVKSLVSG